MAGDTHIYSGVATFISTYGDVTSDIINSLDFLGYNASNTIEKEVWEKVATWIGKEVAPKPEVINGTNDTTMELNTMELNMENYTIHEIWGAMGFFIIFLPGIIMAPSFLLRNLSLIHI